MNGRIVKMNSALIAFGSNIGDRLSFFQKALDLMNLSGIIVVKHAPPIVTAPQGMNDDSEYFLNTVVLIQTELRPHDLLIALKLIEEKLGRNNSEKGHSLSRTCDLDIILYDDIVLNSEDLKIPHPEYSNRYFVMKPLNNIASEWIDPVLKRTINQIFIEKNFS